MIRDCCVKGADKAVGRLKFNVGVKMGSNTDEGGKMPIIYHLIGGAEWQKARDFGEVIPESLAAEGFIHCSGHEAQALAVANRIYVGVEGMLVLEVDTNGLTSPVKLEPSRSGEVYPHIYGPLNIDAVVAVRPLENAGDEGFRLGDDGKSGRQ